MNAKLTYFGAKGSKDFKTTRRFLFVRSFYFQMIVLRPPTNPRIIGPNYLYCNKYPKFDHTIFFPTLKIKQ